MSWCCPLFICSSFFFWSELAEYVMVLSTVYMFVIFLLVGAGCVCHGVVHCLYVCHFSSGRSWLSMSWCCPLFICLSFFFWPELAEKKNDKHINSEQHHDILNQLRPEEK
jgi:hypothetical protein